LTEEKSLRKLEEAVVNGDVDGAKDAASKVLKANLNPVDVIENNLAHAMKIVGKRFERGEYFLSNLIMSGEAMTAAISILTKDMNEESKEHLKKGPTIFIGTVKGDVHDIGKNIVATLLKANGFNVYDAGTDLDPMEIIKKAEEVKADIIALSALMTVSMPYQAEVINFLKELKLRDKYKVIVGGGPTSQEWAEKIGADGWAPDASAAVVLVKKLLQ